MNPSLKVQNISPDITAESLEQFFRIAGPVRKVMFDECTSDKLEQISKTAIIIMSNDRAAKKALHQLSHICLNDRKLFIRAL